MSTTIPVVITTSKPLDSLKTLVVKCKIYDILETESMSAIDLTLILVTNDKTLSSENIETLVNEMKIAGSIKTVTLEQSLLMLVPGSTRASSVSTIEKITLNIYQPWTSNNSAPKTYSITERVPKINKGYRNRK